MCLRNKRDASADLMLMELAPIETWETIATGVFDEKGDLIDAETKEVLAHGTDIILSKTMEKREFHDQTLNQWTILYKIKKILKSKRNSDIDWDALFIGDEE